MEDIALSRSLKRVSLHLCLADKAVTSGRRWERHGVLRTAFLMAWLRLAFFFGAAPASLARFYDGERRLKPAVASSYLPARPGRARPRPG